MRCAKCESSSRDVVPEVHRPEALLALERL
jgi:hypothetical protein